MKLWVLLSAYGLCLSAAESPDTSPILESRAIAIQWANYYASAYGVPYELVAAIIDVESGWQPNVVSAKGAAGLMQLMPATAYQFGVRNRFRIEENLQGGVAYLASLMRRFGGDLRLVAAAYYAGEKRIAKLGLECSDPAVYRYVVAVEREYQLHKKGVGKP
jgi:soluble lytic murein transglycosylase-like protein